MIVVFACAVAVLLAGSVAARMLDFWRKHAKQVEHLFEMRIFLLLWIVRVFAPFASQH